jgi:prepilin-type processing-associated H-X9-DG protein
MPGGGNVLYMDGHTEFVKYPGTFPMSKNVLPALGKLQDFDTLPEMDTKIETGGPTPSPPTH